MKKQILAVMVSMAVVASACSLKHSCMGDGCPACATGPKTPAYFAFDSDSLTAADKDNLNKIAEKLKRNPTKKIKISGFTDDVGTKAYNQVLSVRRATNAARYLESKGIASERMTIMGYGASRFAQTNSTKEGRAKNRRVEIWCH